MGIGRRSFIAQVSAFVGSAIVGVAKDRFTYDERFVSKDLGITFLKPRGWIFIEPEVIRQEADSIGEMALISEVDPSVMNISKEPWQTNPKRFTPGINIWSYLAEDFENSLELFMGAMVQGQSFYGDFMLYKEVESIAVSGCPAVLRRASFTFDTEGLDRPTPLNVRFLCIHQGKRFCFVYMSDSPDLGYCEEEEYLKFINSILLA